MRADSALAAVPPGLCQPLFDAYTEIVTNYLEHRWEPAELNGGKFCEVVYCIIQGALSGSYASAPSKPANLRQACLDCEQVTEDPDRVGDRSFRVMIPRAISILYEIRNNRGVGHVGGDVDPNLQDASAVYSIASWIMAELVRIFYNTTLSNAQQIVAKLVERPLVLVWEIGNVQRVLNPRMAVKDQILLLLFYKSDWVSVSDLMNAVEYANRSRFLKEILGFLHRERLVEFDKLSGTVHISPVGSRDVATRIIQRQLPYL